MAMRMRVSRRLAAVAMAAGLALGVTGVALETYYDMTPTWWHGHGATVAGQTIPYAPGTVLADVPQETYYDL